MCTRRLRVCLSLCKKALRAAGAFADYGKLLVKHGANYRTIALDYHDGLRYPHLERIPASLDRLAAILKALK